MTDQEIDVIYTMEKYGGSFVSALAIAWFRADQINFVKLKATFPEYWQEYEQMAEQIKKNKEQL